MDIRVGEDGADSIQDSVLALVDPSGHTVAQNDDISENDFLSAIVGHNVQQDGSYLITVSVYPSRNGYETGPFSLTVDVR